MKKFLYVVMAAALVSACGTTKQKTTKSDVIVTNIDLVNVQDDKISVSVDPGKFTKEATTFFIPKTVPGTYEINNYGQFVENVTALDYDGEKLKVTKLNKNAWKIENAAQLDKVTYWVNDTYDIEGEGGVFSPAGVNIDAGENFMLNLHGLVGYFKGMKQQPYKLMIKHPKKLIASTSLTEITSEKTAGEVATDVFKVPRYFQVTDHPIMYAAPDTVSFELQGMEVLLSVYSPNDVVSAEDLSATVKEMVVAQKKFLGDINSTDKYAILLYLSEMDVPDARGFGALEHHTSTTVLFPETMPLPRLKKAMTNVVSHEFFHTLTPLNVHSKEIHYFDYNNPEMSKHLWMYEGVTEYFAKLFQVNQGLIKPKAFYDHLMKMIRISRTRYNDTMSMTVMSENIYQDKYHENYGNVYQKGALIGMTLDIRLRELSNGEMGLLDLMKKLSAKYGVNKPFNDDKLFDVIVEMTYPEIETFFKTYVAGTTPIPYDEFFAKVGVEKTTKKVNTGYFFHMKTRMPYINVSRETGEVYFRKNVADNSFLKAFGVKAKDTLVSVNGTEYTIKNARQLIMKARSWKPGEKITMVVKREGEEITLTGEVTQPTTTVTSLTEMDLPETDPRVQLRKAWLKG